MEQPKTRLRIAKWDKHFENASSRKLTRLNWVAIPNKTDGEGYTALVDHPNAAAHLGAWYAIVEAASKQDPRGNLPSGIPQDVGGISRSLGRMSRLPAKVFTEVIPRLIEIGWIEEVQQNQYNDIKTSAEPADQTAEYADALAEYADALADSGREVAAQGIEVHGIELHGREENLFAEIHAADSQSMVRPVVSSHGNGTAKRRRKGTRTTEEVRAALGPRTVWFDELWKVGPWEDGKLGGMDAYERRVTDHDLAVLVYKGAKRYRAKCDADPTMSVKFLQGWINDERWNDESAVAAKPKTKAEIRAAEWEAVEL
jgi:hypothetical protein